MRVPEALAGGDAVCGRYQALAIGGSAGSLPVIGRLLEALPAASTLSVVVCMHIADQQIDEVCAVLARHCALAVVEAVEGEPIAPGAVYVAAAGYHLLVEKSKVFSLCAGEPVNFSQPSIDILFDTMADAYRADLAALLLSGANHHGAAGLRRIQALGGHTRIQAPETASSPDMPRAALAMSASHVPNSPAELQHFVHDISTTNTT